MTEIIPSKYRYLIGIDPDLKESGFAIWDRHEKKFTLLTCLDMVDLNDALMSRPEPSFVVLEAGWLIGKANWHNSGKGRAAERTAKNVGENHGTGKIIMAFCIKKNIPYTLIKPKGKITHQLFQVYTRWTENTNQEERDAAMLVFGF